MWLSDYDFVFDYVHLLYYKCHKRSLNRGGSYIDSPDWMKNKKVTINLINKKDNKYFRPWDQTNLVLNSIEKVKSVFLLSSTCMFSESRGTRFWSHSFHLQNSGILQSRMNQICADLSKKSKYVKAIYL